MNPPLFIYLFSLPEQTDVCLEMLAPQCFPPGSRRKRFSGGRCFRPSCTYCVPFAAPLFKEHPFPPPPSARTRYFQGLASGQRLPACRASALLLGCKTQRLRKPLFRINCSLRCRRVRRRAISLGFHSFWGRGAGALGETESWGGSLSEDGAGAEGNSELGALSRVPVHPQLGS